MTSAPNEFSCVECFGSGVVHCGMGPTPIPVECDDCGGSGAVGAAKYLDQCRMQIFYARQNFHRRWKASRSWAWEAHELAQHWLREATKARAIVLEQEHAGMAHIGRAA